jgi:hypothetical protein
MGYPILIDFEESAREPTVRFNIQPATWPTGFSHLQLNEANSSNQCMLARSAFPPVISHERAPSTLATQIASTGRIVNAAIRSLLPSVSKQGTNVARFCRPGSA